MADLKGGCILFDRDFQFWDQEIGEKLIVVLNNPRKSEPYLVCRTTSKEKSYRKKIPIGCQDSIHFFIKAGSFFPKDTWLQLYEIFEYKRVTLLNKHFKGNLEIKNCLDEITLRQLKNCIKKSEDISEENLDMILETIV